MGETTKIRWSDCTWNPWIGCQRWSPGCGQGALGGCYAEFSTPVRVHRARGLELWGPPSTTPRHRTSDALWRKPALWNEEARMARVRRRMFVGSLMDFFERHPDVVPWRAEALARMERWTWLDIQLLTKRPENIPEMVPAAWMEPGGWPPHVWVGASAENGKYAAKHIPALFRVPAPILYLSGEPLLGDPDLVDWLMPDDHPCCLVCGVRPSPNMVAFKRIHGPLARCPQCDAILSARIRWAIFGGESPAQPSVTVRSMDLRWARLGLAACAEAGVPAVMKQTGARVRVSRLDAPWFQAKGLWTPDAPGAEMGTAIPAHPKGGDEAEWPPDLRVEQYPTTPRASA